MRLRVIINKWQTEEIKQVTTINPKHVSFSTNSYQNRMLKMKKDILENSGNNDDTNTTNDVSSNGTNTTKDVSSNDNTTKDVYFYGIAGVSILQ